MAKSNVDYIGVCPSFSKVDFLDKDKRINDYMREFFNRSLMLFEYEGLPKTIPKRNLELMLQNNGCVGIAKVNGELYAFVGGLGGLPNEYYMPTIFTVANPYLKFSKNLKIDEEVIIIPNDSTYSGLFNIHSKYATLLTENDISIRNSLITIRIPSLISSKDDKTFKSAIKFLKDIEDGKLGVIGESAFLDGLKSLPFNPQSNNSITQLIEMKQYIKASWFNELGLNANYNMKRESINSNESQLNDDMLHPLIDDMLEQRKLALEKVNALFGTNISVKFNSAWFDNELEKEIVIENLQQDDKESVDKVDETIINEEGKTNV